MDQRRGPIVIDQIEQLGETTDARVSTHVPYIILESKEADHTCPTHLSHQDLFCRLDLLPSRSIMTVSS
jgi:hypothetical protein